MNLIIIVSHHYCSRMFMDKNKNNEEKKLEELTTTKKLNLDDYAGDADDDRSARDESNSYQADLSRAEKDRPAGEKKHE
ncbi:MAG: hypothetical protein ACJ749_19745 [Flavisolibacter sp.]